MTTQYLGLPDPASWPLQVFTFARRNQKPTPGPSTTALFSTDLKYYLRVMRGPHWRLTVPLCVNEATDLDVQVLETALAYMETAACALWFYPMEIWRHTRVFLIAVHAWAHQDPRILPYDWQGMRDLIPHVTPHTRDGPVPDMIPTLTGLGRLYKDFFPMEIFHYRKIYYREHITAVARIFQVVVWRDVGTQWDGTDHDPPSGEESSAELERSDACTPVDIYDSDIHRAKDPREETSICVTPRTLPPVSSPGILLQIPLPTPLV